MTPGGTDGPGAVLLDALGTLVSLEPPAPLLQAQLAARGVLVTQDQALAALRAEIRFYRAHHDEAVDAAALDDLRSRCTAVLREALPPAARDLPDLRDALLASLRFRAYAEVPAVLRELRARGARLVVVSNWDVSLHEVLSETGLTDLVDGAISSAEAGVAKPDPQIFAMGLALAGVEPHEAVHVGDTVSADVDGALAAGVRPVLVDREEPVPGQAREGSAAAGTLVVPDLEGLLGPPLYRQDGA
jgi:putative hydrolase of the HAD superfamily